MVSSRKQAEIKGHGGQLYSVALNSSHYSNMFPDFILIKSFKILASGCRTETRSDIISCLTELDLDLLHFYLSIGILLLIFFYIGQSNLVHTSDSENSMHSAALSKPFLDSVFCLLNKREKTQQSRCPNTQQTHARTHTAGFKELNKKEINLGQGIKYADDWPNMSGHNLEEEPRNGHTSVFYL